MAPSYVENPRLPKLVCENTLRRRDVEQPDTHMQATRDSCVPLTVYNATCYPCRLSGSKHHAVCVENKFSLDLNILFM